MKAENCWCGRKGTFFSATGESRCGYHLAGLPEPITKIERGL